MTLISFLHGRGFSSNLHQAGWGYNSCTGGADADADAASVCCWLYGVFFINFDSAADAARTIVMQEGLLNFGILLWCFAEGILGEDLSLLQWK
ncbi:hypothetical protein Nepgr_014769 [Nepenthes gracilis]|uniref:Uncharacterized protein n=1 Tax=Nepenthes gracilis TaxID=150966 RepID=A0AAD3XQ56_NEPGR|nr:hypothetical protein Nepgr_014769 [Nepenthes gracilis]